MLDLLFSSAMAQEAATAAEQMPQQSPLMQLAPFAIIFVIFYFLMIKPQKKKLEEEQSFLSALNKGDEVYTKSGVLGTVHGIADKIVTLEVSEGVKLKVLKSQLGGLAKKLLEAPEKAPAK